VRIISLDSALTLERTTQSVRLNAARSIMVSSARYFAASDSALHRYHE